MPRTANRVAGELDEALASVSDLPLGWAWHLALVWVSAFRAVLE